MKTWQIAALGAAFGIGTVFVFNKISSQLGIPCSQLQIRTGGSYEIHVYATSATDPTTWIGEVSQGSSVTRVTGLPNDYAPAREALRACVLNKGAFAVYEVDELIKIGTNAHTLYIWTKGGRVFSGEYASPEQARRAAREKITLLA